jgi:hypothetical protein
MRTARYHRRSQGAPPFGCIPAPEQAEPRRQLIELLARPGEDNGRLERDNVRFALAEAPLRDPAGMALWIGALKLSILEIKLIFY